MSRGISNWRFEQILALPLNNWCKTLALRIAKSISIGDRAEKAAGQTTSASALGHHELNHNILFWKSYLGPSRFWLWLILFVTFWMASLLENLTLVARSVRKTIMWRQTPRPAPSISYGFCGVLHNGENLLKRIPIENTVPQMHLCIHSGIHSLGPHPNAVSA